MSKKNKRQVSNKQANRPASTSAIAANSTEFKPDYSTSKRELGRIAVLASTFIIILVVLSFFQDQLLALFVK